MGGIDVVLEERIRRALDGGDPAEAATVALKGYGAEIFGYLTVVLRDDDRAADAFSAFSEDLWKSLPGFRAASSFRTWAYKLAWHAAIDLTREPHRKRAVPLATSLASELAAQVRSSTAVHLQTETKTSIQKLREELTPDEQTLLILRIDRALAWDEIADVMEIDAAAVRKRFERVKDKLRVLAVERGLTAK